MYLKSALFTNKCALRTALFTKLQKYLHKLIEA